LTDRVLVGTLGFHEVGGSVERATDLLVAVFDWGGFDARVELPANTRSGVQP
jgi:hypothetical protein